jgi:hypothetical protein
MSDVERVDESRVASLGPWLGIAGGPVLWMIHLLGSSVFASYLCSGAWGSLPLHLLTIGTGAAAALCAVASFLSGRARNGSDGGSHAGAGTRRRFMSRLGTLIGLISLLLIVLEGTPNFFPELCL